MSPISSEQLKLLSDALRMFFPHSPHQGPWDEVRDHLCPGSKVRSSILLSLLLCEFAFQIKIKTSKQNKSSIPNFFKKGIKANIDGHKICIKDIIVRENKVSDGSERKASQQGVRFQDDHRLAKTQPTTPPPPAAAVYPRSLLWLSPNPCVFSLCF